MLDAVVIGAGPAGLTAAHELAHAGRRVAVLEADPQYVGGISRTVEYKGYRFDIGGHRFFSKSKEIEDFWSSLLGDDLLVRPRLSRIFYNGKFFSYPLRPAEAFFKLGPLESVRCLTSYLLTKVVPQPASVSFEDWVSSRFGRRLYEIFFRTYTEKVWGMSCKEISSDWAAQRIKGLSLTSALMNAINWSRSAGDMGEDSPKTLIRSFRYPRHGPGMMWERCAEKIRSLGGEISQGWTVEEIHWQAAERRWHVTAVNPLSERRHWIGRDLISSMPLRHLAERLRPGLSRPAARAAEGLRYRDFLTVALILDRPLDLDDNWIYIHDPGVKVGRIQNFRSWSPQMLPSGGGDCLGLEYFCFEGDGLWNAPDSELRHLAAREIAHIGLAEASSVLDSTVVRQPKAYPVYDDSYMSRVDALRAELAERFPHLHLIGRNGMHKYNNQDHSMMTALLTARNILAGAPLYDVWQVNEDAQYHEEHSPSTSGLRAVPARLAS